MIIEKTIQLLDARFMVDSQELWDNSGPQFVFPRDELDGIMTCLDFSESVLRQAESNGANLIVSHHPFFFEPLKCLSDSSPAVKAVFEAVSKRISLVSYHTCADKIYLTALASEITGYDANPSCCGSYAVIDTAGIKLNDFLGKLSDRLSAPVAGFTGDPGAEIRKAAFINGSGSAIGSKILEKSDENGINCVITGDVTYHRAFSASSSGGILIDAGHFNTEKLIPGMMKNDIVDCLTKCGIGAVKVDTAVEINPVKHDWRGNNAS